MKKDFFTQCAEHIIRQRGANLSDFLLLFPNRRSLLHFRKALVKVCGKPIWAPQMYTLDGWIKEQSRLVKVEELASVIALYKSWQQEGGAEHFDAFYTLGLVMLKDFNNILEAMADRASLFKELSALGAWDTDYFDEGGSELASLVASLKKGALSASISEVYRRMGPVLNHFEAGLRGKGLGTPGMMYADVAEQWRDKKESSFTAAYAIGFFQMSQIERFILSQIPGLQCLWHDLPEPVAAALDWQHPLKSFMEQMKERSVRFVVSEAPGEIMLIPSGSPSIQMQTANALLSDVGFGVQAEQSIMVLSEQGQLLPLLQSLVPTVIEVNVSMGLSVLDTGVFALIERYLYCLETKQGDYWSISALKQLADHHLVGELKQLSQVLWQAQREKRYLSGAELSDSLTEDWKGLLLHADLKNMLPVLLQLTGIAYKEAKTELDKSGSFAIYSSLQNLFQVLESEMELISPNMLRLFLKRIFQQSRVTLSGEPLKGLQVLGPQELSNLGAQTLFYFDVNEGVMPSANFSSCLPISILKAYRLPQVADQVQMQAAVFWTSIQAAERVVIFYSPEGGGLSRAEASRWVQQMQLGLIPDTWKIKQMEVQTESKRTEAQVLYQEASASSAEAVKAWLHEKTISPTALNTWLHCKLKFYYQYVLNLREPSAKEVVLEAGEFGSIVHDVLETFYKDENEESKIWTQELLSEKTNQLEELVFASYQALFKLPAHVLYSGEHQLNRGIIEKAVNLFLQKDVDYAPFQIKSLEKELSYKTMHPSLSVPLTFEGKVDRIDEKDGNVRIVDFKTGKDKNQAKTFKYDNLWKRDGKNHKELLQVAFYSWLYHKSYPAEMTPEVRLLYPSQGTDIEKCLEDFRNQLNPAFFTEFEQDLMSQIQDMVEGRIEQTENLASCAYCPFKVMCMRD